jgi:hypothetical protein
MYCPRCSQPQTAEDVSFCTRCGFPLSPVRELLAGGGAAQPLVSQAARGLRRRKKARFGFKLMFFSLILFPIFLALSIAVDSPEPLVPPAVIFFAGLTFTLYSWIFGEDTPAATGTTTTFAPAGMDQRGLPSPPAAPPLAPGTFGELPEQRANTAEMIHPPSVTERTTNLLEKSTE